MNRSLDAEFCVFSDKQKAGTFAFEILLGSVKLPRCHCDSWKNFKCPTQLF